MKLDASTAAPIGSMIVVAAGFLAGYRWLDDRLDDSDTLASKQVAEANSQFQLIGFRLSRIEEQVSDRWTRPEMISLWNLLGALNPSLKLPQIESR